jgi:hypothetical protein
MARPWYPMTAEADGVKLTVNRDPGSVHERRYERTAAQADRAEVRLRSLLSGVRILLGESVSAPLLTAHEAYQDAVGEQVEALLRLAALDGDEYEKGYRALGAQRAEMVKQLGGEIEEARRIASDALDLVKGTLEIVAQLADVIEAGPMGGKGRSTPATRTARRVVATSRADAERLERELFPPVDTGAPF